LITVCCVEPGLILVVQRSQRLGLIHWQVNCLSLENTDICSLYSLPIIRRRHSDHLSARAVRHSAAMMQAMLRGIQEIFGEQWPRYFLALTSS
jgi:hypothetical protein